MNTSDIVSEINELSQNICAASKASRTQISKTNTESYSVWRSLVRKQPELAFLEKEEDDLVLELGEELSDNQILEMKKIHLWREKAKNMLTQQNRETILAKYDFLTPPIIKADELKFRHNFDPFDKDHVNAMIRAQREDFYRTKGWSNTSAITSSEQAFFRRQKFWISMMKKEIPKAHRTMMNQKKELVGFAKKCAKECMRSCRQKYNSTMTKGSKDAAPRAKRLVREVALYWKQYHLVEKAYKKKAEKHLNEQRKADLELLEARRQQRKLNFLLTQTELYAHFMAHKDSETASKDDILGKLDDTYAEGGKLSNVSSADNYQPEVMKLKAVENVEQAIASQSAHVRSIDDIRGGGGMSVLPDDIPDELQQPSMFQGLLKQYQLKGVNWLLSLYEQGINGILADEMGLGKTIMTMAFFSVLAEKYGIWGPFLVIAPASTLHNWTQELQRFTPSFKVIPYWGSPSERKILRRFWSSQALHSRECSFHIVVTSYQVVLQDVKMIGRIAWQYLVLDEAQAIKSTSSQRWNTLLQFKCRNRLLLTGTPVQNSMQELWALLHFIMPTLFDCHEEFSEWFSKDIENSASSSSDGRMNFNSVDEAQLIRLHLILKPFMLRRVKADVENELAEKIEILYHCDMSRRQKVMYNSIKQKINLEDLAEASLSSDTVRSHSLMNIVMQFRKVCNHPDLFEWRDMCTSFHLQLPDYQLPSLLAEHLLTMNPLLINQFSPHHPTNSNSGSSSLLCMSQTEIHSVMRLGLLYQLELLKRWMLEVAPVLNHRHTWNCGGRGGGGCGGGLLWNAERCLDGSNLAGSSVLTELCSVFLRLPSTPSFLHSTVLTPVHTRLRQLRTNCASVQHQHRHQHHHHLLLPTLSTLFTRPAAAFVDMHSRIADSGKLVVLEQLLAKLFAENHRVLIYSQMTRMIDILEDLMNYKKYKYIRLDGSSRICDRRDMVSDFQNRSDLFVFLLSTRAGGIGINLTAADTVIFFDNDWNPTVDQQAMDRAHRLGQTRQVTVYRLICSGSVEERILVRAEEKSRIQRMVITGTGQPSANPDSGGDVLRPKEMVSLLLDDQEMEKRLELRRTARREERARRAEESVAELKHLQNQLASESSLDRRRKAQWASRGFRARAGAGARSNNAPMECGAASDDSADDSDEVEREEEEEGGQHDLPESVPIRLKIRM